MTDEAVLDVQCLPYMPLEIERLRKSKAWLRCRRQPELAFYLMNLWMRAWHELPAGSIEDDDDVLADAAMCSPERWADIREQVLHGWDRRDGRLYHHVVTEIATEAFGKLRKNKNRTASARQALQHKRDEPVTGVVTEIATEAVTDIVTRPEGKGREEKGKKKDISLDAERDFEEFYQAYPRHVGKGAARAAYAKARRKVSADILLIAAGKYATQVSGKDRKFVAHPATWLNAERWDDDGDANAGSANGDEWARREAEIYESLR